MYSKAKGGRGRRRHTLTKPWVGKLVVFCGVVLALAGAGICDDRGAVHGRRHTVVDMAGRSVSVPRHPRRVVTIRGAPILNTFIFALGKGDTIVNGLPVSARLNQKDCCRLQSTFAPRINMQPSIESKDDISMEMLLLLRPDLVITMMKKYINLLKHTGIPVIYVEMGRDGDKGKDIMRLLGTVYGAGTQAQRYVRYFDSALRRVRSRTSDIPESRRARVLYCNFRTFTQTSPTADWWIETAGGISLGGKGPVISGTRFFSAEDVLVWHPDVLIVSTPGEVDLVYGDPRFRDVAAVRDGRVVSVPTGSLRWSHPTSEQPLMVLWAAKLFYPERFKDLDMKEETMNFYHTFFRYRLTEGQIAEILDGKRD